MCKLHYSCLGCAFPENFRGYGGLLRSFWGQYDHASQRPDDSFACMNLYSFCLLYRTALVSAFQKCKCLLIANAKLPVSSGSFETTGYGPDSGLSHTGSNDQPFCCDLWWSQLMKVKPSKKVTWYWTSSDYFAITLCATTLHC